MVCRLLREIWKQLLFVSTRNITTVQLSYTLTYVLGAVIDPTTDREQFCVLANFAETNERNMHLLRRYTQTDERKVYDAIHIPLLLVV